MILLISLLAGLLQGITGFGSGIVLMMYLPYVCSITHSAAITSAICIALSATMVYQYRQTINIKKVMIPLVLYMLTCTLTISYASMLNALFLKKALGVFLIFLAVYYLFIQRDNKQIKMNIYLSILCIVISAICDGLFGIGGPLMVLYFMNKTKGQKEYLGCIQLFFLINNVYNTGFRVFKGILTVHQFTFILVGAIGIMIGTIIARKVIDYIDEKNVKKIIYVVIGISGIMNLL
ncbi:sulfite exporter TauE/SafE family protein [Coprobacillus sp. AF33-1AC]|uniref:sulfite exporter TauE/SafE family protein n=1 Tax=Coprobacillus sp. AF33-1AC TaxID=2292032 RepID=UPI000E48B13C|nr:sulfite exporter TauE/SafE family protein [Coprobacillus sp. AF33-1AC]RHM59872.1 sulfite exporter TauE/SafE family protein [Coprobacillus sp. AF33-1AC]